MSCLAWNCCGLGNLRTWRELVEIVWAKYPTMAFLAETLTDDARLESVQSSIGFNDRWVVPRVGRSGGLVLCWKAGISSEVGFSDVKELLSWLITEGKPLELFAYMAWMVWNQRNKAQLNLQAIPLHQVVEQAKEMLAQFRAN